MDLMTAMLASKLAGLNPSGGGGGVTDYNKLENKPVGETVVYGDTLTWDGNTDGLVPVDAGDGLVLYKVSDAVVTKEDCANGLVLTIGGEEIPFPGEAIQPCFADDDFCWMDGIAFVPADNYTFAEVMLFPEKGVYSMNDAGMFAEKIVIPGYTDFVGTEIKTLDPKFLPGSKVFDLIALGLGEVQAGGETVTLECDTADIRAAMEVGTVKFKVELSQARIGPGYYNGVFTVSVNATSVQGNVFFAACTPISPYCQFHITVEGSGISVGLTKEE